MWLGVACQVPTSAFLGTNPENAANFCIALEVAPSTGVVLIDGEALIDLVIETTLKDESKPSGFGRLAQRFRRAS